jgi:hypothetical protein
MFGLVYLDSINFFFDTKSGCFYGSLRNGNQEETIYDFSIQDYLKDISSYTIMKSLNKDESKIINDYLLRVRANKGFIYND